MRIHLYPTTFSFTDTTLQNMNSMLESLIFTFHSIVCLVTAFFFFLGSYHQELVILIQPVGSILGHLC